MRRAFADRVDVDYSSLFGVPAAAVAADDQVAGWRAFASVFDATQHVTGPIVMTQDTSGATAHTHVRAYHQIKGAPGGEIWMVAGHYRVRLVLSGNTWKIAGITLTVFYQSAIWPFQISRSRAPPRVRASYFAVKK